MSSSSLTVSRDWVGGRLMKPIHHSVANAMGFTEVFYDFDCPGHYMRRIKSVSVTIP
jgi:hypothetical protein